MSLRSLGSLAALILLAACTSSERAPSPAEGDTGGTVVLSVAAEPDILLAPYVQLVSGNQVVDALFDRLAETGPSLNTIGDADFQPELAESWSWGNDSLSIAFKLHPRARWHDGRPVTSRDVRFTYQLYVDPAAATSVAPLMAGRVDSVSTPDSLTAVFWFKQRYPEQFFDAGYQMRILPEHLLASVKPAELRSSPFARQPVGSGPFRFVRWVPGTLVEVVADTGYHLGRPKLDRVIWSISAGYPPALNRLLAGEADFLELILPTFVDQVRAKPELELREYGSLDFGFLHFNTRAQGSRRPHPILGEREMRRALAMSVDRVALVRNVFGESGRIAYGPFTRAVATADTTIGQIGYDTTAAKRLLDSLGWRDANGDGIRERNGRQLRFAIAYPTSSEIRRQNALILQESLRRIGARVDIDAFEITQFRARLEEGRFDAAMNAWHLDASPSGIRQTWGGEAARTTGVNYGRYESPAFDALVDSASNEMDAARARQQWRRAYEMLVADAPAIFLYEIVNRAGVHKRVRTPGMRADAFWADLRQWSIPAGERIARDRAAPAAGAAQ